MLEPRADSQPANVSAEAVARSRKPFVTPSVETLGELTDLTHTASGEL
jgi:hypothetical protein